MTRDELKVRILGVLDVEGTTKEIVGQELGRIFLEFIPESIRRDEKRSRAVMAYGDVWNSVMAEIVTEERSLGSLGSSGSKVGQ